MKLGWIKAAIVALLLLSVHSGYSQIEKGTHSLGLEFSKIDYSNSLDNLKSRALTVTPSYSYFFKDNHSIISGASVGRTRLTRENTAVNSYNTRDWSLFAFSGIRKYMPIDDKLFLMGTVGVFYNYDESNYLYDNSESLSGYYLTRGQRYSYGLFGNFGIVYFPSSKWSVELVFLESDLSLLKATYTSTLDVSEGKGWKIGLNGFMNQPKIGFRYYFLRNGK